MPKALLIVASNPTTPDADTEFNVWHTDHIETVAADLQRALGDGRMRRSDTLAADRKVDFYVTIPGAERPRPRTAATPET